MTKTIDYWYEFSSPFSYLTAMRIEALVKENGVEAIWQPFLLGGIYRMLDVPIPPMQLFPMKEDYMWMDAARQAKRHGIPFRKPDNFPQVAVLPARVAQIGFQDGWGEDFSKRVYQAIFAHNQVISEVEVISKILTDMGYDPEAVLARATAPENKKLLMEQTQKAFDKGIFGVPTFYIGDEMIWGNDRLEQALGQAGG